MHIPSIQQNDVGTQLIIPVTDQDGEIVDLSLATEKIVVMRSLDKKTRVEAVPYFVTDGTDGKLGYLTTGLDFTKSGLWKVQAYVELPAGNWRTTETSLSVKPNL